MLRLRELYEDVDGAVNVILSNNPVQHVVV